MIIFDSVTLPAEHDAASAVVDLSERFPPNHVGVIVGGSHAETLILRAVVGLTLPRRGAIRVGGIDVGRNASVVRQRATFVPHHAPVRAHLRTIEQVRYLMTLTGHYVLEKQIITALRSCAIPDRLIFGRASMLEAVHRIGLWLAVYRLRESAVLLMHDPTAGLTDSQTRLVGELIRETLSPQHSVLMSSRDEAFSDAVADTVYRMDRQVLAGRPVERSPWSGLFATP